MADNAKNLKAAAEKAAAEKAAAEKAAAEKAAAEKAEAEKAEAEKAEAEDLAGTVLIDLPVAIKYAFDGLRVECFGPGKGIEVPEEVAKWVKENQKNKK